MSSFLKNVFGGIHQQGPFMRSLQYAMKLEERDKATDLSCVQTQVYQGFDNRILSSGVKSFHVCADVTNPNRSGFSVNNDHIRIFRVEGLQTFDGAFGFLTEEVDQAKNVYKSSCFRYYPKPELHPSFSNISLIHEYDGSKRQWEPLFYIFYCPSCHAKIFAHMIAAKCLKCNMEMVMEMQSQQEINGYRDKVL